MKVVLNGTILAESDKTVVVENNHYFPPESVTTSLFSSSDTSSVCQWKGTASYYDAKIGEQVISDVAWYYKAPLEKAQHIKDYVAFYKYKVAFEP